MLNLFKPNNKLKPEGINVSKNCLFTEVLEKCFDSKSLIILYTFKP